MPLAFSVELFMLPCAFAQVGLLKKPELQSRSQWARVLRLALIRADSLPFARRLRCPPQNEHWVTRLTAVFATSSISS